jgi:hypothetical protein
LGVVYTPLVRLAMQLQSATRDGLNPEEITPAKVGPEVVVVWQSEPSFSPSLPAGGNCTSIVSGPTMRMGMRPRGANLLRVAPFKTASFDAQENSALLSRFGIVDPSTAHSVAAIDPSELAQDSILFWSATYQCANGGIVIDERFALVSADDLRAWR